MLYPWVIKQIAIEIAKLQQLQQDAWKKLHNDLSTVEWLRYLWPQLETSLRELIEAEANVDAASALVCIQLCESIAPVYRFLPPDVWADIAEKLVRTAMRMESKYGLGAMRALRRDLIYILKIRGKVTDALTVSADNLAHSHKRRKSEPEAYLECIDDAIELHDELGDITEVRRLSEKTVAFREAMGVTGILYADSVCRLGALYLNLGKKTRAKGLLNKAIRIYRRALKLSRDWTGRAARSLASALQLNERTDQAATVYERIRECYREQGRLADDEFYNLLKKMSITFQMQGQMGEARRCLEEFLAIRLTVFGEMDITYAIALGDLGAVLAEMGEYDLAVETYHQSLELQSSMHLDGGSMYTETMNNLAFIYDEEGQSSAAESLFREVVNRQRTLVGHAHPDVADALVSLGVLLMNRGSLNEAEDRFNEALTIRRRSHGEHSYEVAETLCAVGILAKRLGEIEKAISCLLEAEMIYKQTVGMKADEYHECVEELAQCKRTFAL